MRRISSGLILSLLAGTGCSCEGRGDPQDPGRRPLDTGVPDATASDGGGGGRDGGGGGCDDPGAASVDVRPPSGVLYTNPRFSPDGARIAVLAWRGLSFDDVRVVDRCGNVLRSLGVGSMALNTSTWSPAWSADSIYLAGLRGRGILRVPADGSGAAMQAHSMDATALDVSPDGARLVVRSRTGALSLIELASGSMTALNVSGSMPRFSPDGTRIVYLADSTIRVMELSNRRVTDVLALGSGSATADWIDGRRIAFASSSGIQLVDLAFPGTSMMIRSESVARDVDVAAGGRSIAYGLNGQPPFRILNDFAGPLPDAGLPDAGGDDAGVMDAGPVDAGSPDTGDRADAGAPSADALPSQDALPAQDALPSPDALPVQDASPPPDALPLDAEPPRDAISPDAIPEDALPFPDAAPPPDVGPDCGVSMIERSSLSSSGAEAPIAPGPLRPRLSADGRFAVFAADAPALAANDTNGLVDLYVRDHTGGVTERVSLGVAGAQANGASSSAEVSDDGRFVAFASIATNLVASDTNGATNAALGEDVFLHDRTGGSTVRVNVRDNNGAQSTGGRSREPALDSSGLIVAFSSAATNLIPADNNAREDVFVHLVATGDTELISVATDGTQGNGDSSAPSVSGDGRLVAFVSAATNLIAGADANGAALDVLLRDRVARTTRRISSDSAGAQAAQNAEAPRISRDGRFVVFETTAALIATDTNGLRDVYLRDLGTGALERVSVAPGGLDANGVSFDASVSRDGRYVAFTSLASNLVLLDGNNAADVFVRDRAAGTTTRASVDPMRRDVAAESIEGAISPDGRYVAFTSAAATLAPNDGNGTIDVFRAPVLPACP